MIDLILPQAPRDADPWYSRLVQEDLFKPHREFLRDLWPRYAPFADRDFASHFPFELQSRFWEMFLACALMERGRELAARRYRPNAGPDICVLDDRGRVWIDAIAPGPGTGPDSVPPLGPKGGWVSEDRIVLRFRAAIEDKIIKFNEYLAKGIVFESDRIIIALCGAKIPNSDCMLDDIPYPIQAVLPFGPYTAWVDPVTHEVVREGFKHRPQIVKRSGATVNTTGFQGLGYDFLSSLLFADAHVLRTTNLHSVTLSMIHNPQPSRSEPSTKRLVG